MHDDYVLATIILAIEIWRMEVRTVIHVHRVIEACEPIHNYNIIVVNIYSRVWKYFMVT
jgi:hypothetical protein